MNEEDYKKNEGFTIRKNIVYYSSIKSKRITCNIFAFKIYSYMNSFDLRYIIGYILCKVISWLDLPTIPLVVYTDSYSLYECLIKFGITIEKRLIINIIRLKKSYKKWKIKIYWINGQDNLADILTKTSLNKVIENFVTKNELMVCFKGWMQKD